MNTNDKPTDTQEQAAQLDAEAPWEEIEPGRFMPRRVRGSFRGRALGWAFLTPPGSGGPQADDKQ